MKLENKTAIVTGASKGLGQAIAVALAEAGADVAISYNSDLDGAKKTANVIESHGQKALIFQADATNYEASEKFISETIKNFGQIDILVNNVGGADTIPAGGFINMPMEYWLGQFNKNLNSAVYCCQLALKHMTQRKSGTIINISSVHAEGVYNLKVMPYACAKQALNHFTRFLAVEMAPYNIRVNSLSPGLFVTATTERRYSKKWWDNINAKIPLGRPGRLDEIGKSVVFLASEDSGYITGQVIGADGGRSLV